jgi:hypothetical protein
MDGKRQRKLTSSVSQILFEENNKRSQQKKIGTYRTRFFHMCPGAQQIFPEIEEDIGGKDAAMLARMADQIFSIEEKVLSAGEPSEEATASAKKIYSELMSGARKLGVADKLQFMEGHMDIIERGSRDEEKFAKTGKAMPGMGMRAFAGDMDGALDDGAVDGGMGGGMMGESFIAEEYKGKKKKKKKGKEHYCASHTEHYKWGVGRCISESHAEPDRYGHVAWYDVEFDHGIERGVPISEMKILMGESHHHMKEELDPVGKEDGDIDNDGIANSPRDKYLKNRRDAIGKAIARKEGKTLKERKSEILSAFISEEDGDKEDMEKVVDELKGASKMHLGQSKRLSKYLKGDKKKVNEAHDMYHIQQPDKRYTSDVDKDDPTKITYTSVDTAGARRFTPSQAYAMVQGGKARGDVRSMVKADPDAQADFHQHLDDSGVLLAKDHKRHGIKGFDMMDDERGAYSFSSNEHDQLSDPHRFHDMENQGVSAVGFMPKGGLNLDPQKVRAERMATGDHQSVMDIHDIKERGNTNESYTPKDLREATMNRIKRVSSGIGHNPNPAMDRFRGI